MRKRKYIARKGEVIKIYKPQVEEMKTGDRVKHVVEDSKQGTVVSNEEQ